MDELQALFSAHHLSLPDAAISQLAQYRALLVDWNARMDLTSVKAQEIGERHFLDSLLPLCRPGLIPEGARLIDVGTGAGFPGLPLAIARQDLRVTLLEAQGKRCQFLGEVCRALSLSNVEIINDRAETLGRAPGHREAYDLAAARAVAPLNVLCEYLLPFVKVGGRALCWKGPAAAEEARDGAAAAEALGGRMEPPLEMPLQDRKNFLVPIRKETETLPQYPRKNGMPAKRPLKADKIR